MNFDAKEINRQATRIDEERNNFYNDCNYMIKTLHELREIVKSEDSELSRTIDSFANSYIYFQTQINNKFGALSNIMANYAKTTIQNEENASEDIQTLNSNLQDINNTVSSISEDVPEIFADFD